MEKKDIRAEEGAQNSFLKVKTYSVAEIMAAGGTTAFASQLGKNPENTITRLKSLSKEDFLTDEEANAVLDHLKSNK